MNENSDRHPPTLVEFLLARIAEKRAAAEAEVERAAGSPRRAGKTHALRQAREAEAMRQIVRRCTTTAPDFGKPGSEWVLIPTERIDILHALAGAWADHPDYDEART